MKKRTLIIAIDPISADIAKSLIKYGILGTECAQHTYFLVVNKAEYIRGHLDHEPFTTNFLTDKSKVPTELLSLTERPRETRSQEAFALRKPKKIWLLAARRLPNILHVFAKRVQTHHIRFQTARAFLLEQRIEQLIFTHEVPGNGGYYFRLAALDLGLKSVLVPLKVPFVHGVEKHRMTGLAKRKGPIKRLFMKFIFANWVSRLYGRHFALRLTLEETFYLRWWHPQPKEPFANGTLPYEEVWLRSEDKRMAWKPVLHPQSRPLVTGHPHDLAYAVAGNEDYERDGFYSKLKSFDAAQPTICIFLPSNLNKQSAAFRAQPFNDILRAYQRCLAHLQSQPVNVFLCPHPRLTDEDLQGFYSEGVTVIRDRATTFLPFLDGAIVDASSSLVDELEGLSTTLLIWDVYDNGGSLMTQPYLEWNQDPSDYVAAFTRKVIEAPPRAAINADLGKAFHTNLLKFLG